MLQKAKAIIKDFKDLPHLMKEAKLVLEEKDRRKKRDQLKPVY